MNIIDLDFYELIDLTKLKNLIKNWDSIDIKWGKRSERKDSDSQKSIVKRYFYKMKAGTATTYNFAVGKDIGRLFVQNTGLQSIKKEIRSTICSEFYKDIDLKNAQPNLLNEFCKKNKLEVRILNEYCANREKYYHLKQDIIEMIYGGETPPLKNESDYQFILAMSANIKTIADFLLTDPDHQNIIKTLKKQKNENLGGRLLSWFLGNLEAKILGHTLEWCVSKGIDIKNFVLIFDGFMCPKTIEIDLCEINDYILSKTDYSVEFINKEFPDPIDVESDATYQTQKEKFEMSHAKIINKSFYIQFDSDELVFYTEQKLRVSFQHMENDFLKIWVKDPLMRNYTDIGVYPNPESCPENIFNTWKPFVASVLPDIPFKQDDVDFMLNHIKILCNHDPATYNHFILWNAFMVQYPEEKTIIPTIISEQGAGKGSYLEMMRAILGKSKVFDTSKPSQYCWGQFNGPMDSAHLVCFNELSKKEMDGAEGWFKTLATDPYMTINKKGIESYEIRSYHKFIAFSNGEDPMRTSADDRRNFIIKASSELCINHQNPSDPKNENRRKYWIRFYELLKDPGVIRALYNYFKSLDCKNFKSLPIPRTEYHQELLTTNEPLEQTFIKEYINGLTESIVKIQCLKLFQKFQEFLKLQGRTDYTTSNQRFNFRIRNMKIDGITSDEGKYHSRIIDTPKARRALGFPEITFSPQAVFEID